MRFAAQATQQNASLRIVSRSVISGHDQPASCASDNLDTCGLAPRASAQTLCLATMACGVLRRRASARWPPCQVLAPVVRWPRPPHARRAHTTTAWPHPQRDPAPRTGYALALVRIGSDAEGTAPELRQMACYVLKGLVGEVWETISDEEKAAVREALPTALCDPASNIRTALVCPSSSR